MCNNELITLLSKRYWNYHLRKRGESEEMTELIEKISTVIQHLKEGDHLESYKSDLT